MEDEFEQVLEREEQEQEQEEGQEQEQEQEQEQKVECSNQLLLMLVKSLKKERNITYSRTTSRSSIHRKRYI